MNDTDDIWEAVVAARRSGKAAALATIVSTLGSTPGKDPMKMLVLSDGTIVGSVGGGCLEAEVWDHAKTVMVTLRPTTVRFSLTEKDYPDSGLICGGQVEVFIEPVTLPVLHIFGAGHVGAAAARLAATVGLRVNVYDDRADFLGEDVLPDPIGRHPGEFEDTATGAVSGDFDLVIIVTRGHHDDERVLRAIAATGRQPRFLGMIGSKAKHAVLTRRLREDDIDEAFVRSIVTPVGLSIGARTAPEIAVSIVAQLVAIVRGAPETAQNEPTRPESAS